ncbi:hypothetical protein BROUX41_004374 [Berkeleyomyces rouxiae]|uniref:uncharacterized protein n=1 Tax=Berkeleyomyces rouxiae TaxID=2035830 RepID=UPI003B7A5AD2
MAITREMAAHLQAFLETIPTRGPDNWKLNDLPSELTAEYKVAITSAYLCGLRTNDGTPTIPAANSFEVDQVFWASFQGGADRRVAVMQSLPAIKQEEDADSTKETDKHLEVVPYDGNQPCKALRSKGERF